MQPSEYIHLSYPVPYHAQIASPELATQIFEQGMDPCLDPRWAESGANTTEEYAYRFERACGAACVQMCVEALGGISRTLVDWANLGVQNGGYLIKQENDSRIEYGWIHKSLADLICHEGFKATAQPADLDGIIQFICQDQLVIASVSYETGTPFPITKKSGHLIVIHGIQLTDGIPQKLIVHNPSGRTLDMQANARIPVDRFESGYSGRIIVAGKLIH